MNISNQQLNAVIDTHNRAAQRSGSHQQSPYSLEMTAHMAHEILLRREFMDAQVGYMLNTDDLAHAARLKTVADQLDALTQPQEKQ